MSNRSTIYAVFILVFLLIASVVLYFILKTKNVTNKSSLTSSPKAEVWVKNPAIFMPDTTSTDTHKLDDGTFRMYLMTKGNISFADSKDATTFSAPISTGIGENLGKFISNPAVLKIADGDWIMIYEEWTGPLSQTMSQQQEPPGPKNQRNLLLATSTDGKSFKDAGIAIDSSKDDDFFASVPNLIKTPDGKIRMYYVCGGDKTCSAASLDGKSWVKEAGARAEGNAVDPDVLLQSSKWVMYYTELTGANNKFLKSTSSDGLKWTKGQEVLKPESTKGAIVDPDVVEVSPGKWRMFFGEMANGEGQMGGQAQINLYYADFEGDIFN